MVDRYFLPVPKSILLGSYVRPRRYLRNAFIYFAACALFSLQLSRFLYPRVYASKPHGYYIDGGNPDSPMKIQYFN